MNEMKKEKSKTRPLVTSSSIQFVHTEKKRKKEKRNAPTMQ